MISKLLRMNNEISVICSEKPYFILIFQDRDAFTHKNDYFLEIFAFRRTKKSNSFV